MHTRTRPQPLPTRPGQESVWSYPRPPRLETARAHIRVEFAGRVVADSDAAYRVLETSHPPSYYVPPDDCALELLEPAPGPSSFCEWKGAARYETVRAGGIVAVRAVWSYPTPSAGFEPIADHRAFYPDVLECFVDGERALPQPGSFYGGWITSSVVGPFKGEPGSEHW